MSTAALHIVLFYEKPLRKFDRLLGCDALHGHADRSREEKDMRSTDERGQVRVRRRVSNSLLPELWLFVRCSGKWWLVPILLALLLLSGLALFAGAVSAPLLCTLF